MDANKTPLETIDAINKQLLLCDRYITISIEKQEKMKNDPDAEQKYGEIIDLFVIVKLWLTAMNDFLHSMDFAESCLIPKADEILKECTLCRNNLLGPNQTLLDALCYLDIMRKHWRRMQVQGRSSNGSFGKRP